MKLVVVLIFIILQGCTTARKQPPQKANPASQGIFKSAQEDLRSGRVQSGIEKLNGILTSDPQSEIADDAAIALGNFYFKDQNYDKALESYLHVVQSNVSSAREDEARYLGARTLFFMERFDEVLGLLGPTLQKNQASNITLNSLKLAYQTHMRQEEHLKALENLNTLLNHNVRTDKVEPLQNEGLQIIEQKLDWPSINSIAENSDLNKIRGYAIYILARHAADRLNYDEAEDHYEDVISYLPNTSYALEAQKYLANMEARKIVEPKTIGVVLPLTGRHSGVAYRALMGIQLALGIFDDQPSPYKLAVIDSEGNPDIAQKAVERLVLEDHVVAIIGSLLSRTAQVVSQTAHQFGVPSIALSQKSHLTEIGNSVFRNALTSEMQVQHLVDVAMKDYGLKRFAVLYPNDRYGVEFANLFWSQVEKNGGEIAAAQSYKPSETDFKGPIMRMIGTFFIDDRLDEYKHYVKEWQKENFKFIARKSPPEDLLPPIVDFDAIFIPDSTRALAQIAPMLRYNDVSNVLLLGTNLWNSKSLLSRLGPLAENTLFVDSKATATNAPQRKIFVEQFKKTFNKTPGAFEIRGFDTAFLLRSLLDSGLTTRTEVIERLVQIKNFPGIAGPLTVTEKREFALPISSLTVKNRKIEETTQKQ